MPRTAAGVKLLRELTEQLAAKDAEIARLREALEPLADAKWIGGGITTEHILKARAVLASDNREKDILAWIETWICNPASSYSTSALDGLFGMTLDKIRAKK